MGIQEILTSVGPVDAGTGQRGPGAGTDRRIAGREGSADRITVSGQAKALYEADQTQKFDIMRERVRMGYYLKKEVLERVVDALAREVSAEIPAQATL
jgi:hypothetical protein